MDSVTLEMELDEALTTLEEDLAEMTSVEEESIETVEIKEEPIKVEVPVEKPQQKEQKCGKLRYFISKRSFPLNALSKSRGERLQSPRSVSRSSRA